jgi:hypothetical protein
MNETSRKIQMMRDQQLTRAMRVAAIIGFFAVLSSLSRALAIGWQTIMYLHIVLYLVLLGTMLWSRYLSFPLRATIFVAIPFVLGIAGLIFPGMVASSLLALLCFCTLSTILFGPRAGFVSAVVSIAAIGTIGAFVLDGIGTFDFKTDIYLHSPTACLAAMIGMALFTAPIIAALGTISLQTENLFSMLEGQNEDLLRKNPLLENEIEACIRLEEKQRLLENRTQSISATPAATPSATPEDHPDSSRG